MFFAGAAWAAWAAGATGAGGVTCACAYADSEITAVAVAISKLKYLFMFPAPMGDLGWRPNQASGYHNFAAVSRIGTENLTSLWDVLTS
jgi:hypothetical protein